MQSLKADGCLVGFADLAIGDVVEYYPNFFLGFSILFTCLDSSADLRDFGLSIQAKKRKSNVRIIDESLWIDSSEVKDFLSSADRLLTHFDELYLLKGPPPARVSVREIFTTERTRFSEAVPDSFLRFFQSLRATRYLSDGCGLNFVCEDTTIVQELALVESAVANKDT